MADGKFWLVWNEEHGAPTVKHRVRQDALNEADRLARINRGRRFHVLEALCTLETVDVKRTDYDPYDDGIPF